MTSTDEDTLVAFDLSEDVPSDEPPPPDDCEPGRRFDELVARYFDAKSREALHDDGGLPPEPSEAVALVLMTTPAELPRQVTVKITVFETELTAECEDGAWPDHRMLPMFAGLKADLIRFGIGRCVAPIGVEG